MLRLLLKSQADFCRCARFSKMHDSDAVRLWTLQPVAVWHALKEQGELLVNPAHPEFAANDTNDGQDFRHAYDWMREQMSKRVPGYTGGYPWWGYEHFLDLRAYRWLHGTSGAKMVRIELAIPPGQALL